MLRELGSIPRFENQVSISSLYLLYGFWRMATANFLVFGRY